MSGDPLAVRLLAIFVEELDEQLAQMQGDLSALEGAPGDPAHLRSLFRVIHTLKGASRAAGVPLIEQLCHVLEGGLAQAKETSTPLTAAQLSLLVEAADALGDARERLAAGTPVAGAALSALLQRVRGGASVPRAVAPPAVAADVARPPAVTPSAKAASPVAARPPIPTAPEPTTGDAAAPAALAAVPVPPGATAPRDESVRISIHNVDAIAAVAGEIAVLSSALGDHAAEVSALRTRLREQLHDTPSHDARLVDGAFARLTRRAGDDARTLGAIVARLDGAVRHVRQRPLRDLTDTLQRVARDVARDIGKQVRVTVVGAAIEADRVVIEALREPLLHLVRNAVDHGIEPPDERRLAGKPEEGELRIAASLRGDRLLLTLTDDGAGIDPDAITRRLVQQGVKAPDRDELLRVIFDDGFSTRDAATTLSGRGVGLSIVRVAVERLGGTVDVSSSHGTGTTFELDLPLSIATMRALLVRVGTVKLALPSAFVARVQRVAASALARADGVDLLLFAGAPIPITPLATLVGPPYKSEAAGQQLQVVILEAAGQRIAVTADELLDERELVLRPLEFVGPEAAAATVGSALVGAGELVLVLSVPALVARAVGRGSRGAGGGVLPMTRPAPPRARVLVVDDSITSRTLEQSVLAGAGYDVTTAVDGLEAWRLLERSPFALVVSDVEMPRLDGIGLCERIRADARTATVPVILVTSLDKPEQRARGLEAGADAYITKSSFDQEDLLETVRMLLGRQAGAAT